ncbi:FAD-dependent urate hydroxylase HpxO [Falsirhodobacter sp. 20TX0035]|uniref:FAD-dependent urate hydroxylase HpxO n=1 Tax=Falsirhodobacter sp. 20TX0035 TaxID=3022019 RepID=UPI00232EB661|nr:FAD-dependent urate hydroxylase HpxO [Falsirhodobacter sp. 20TX0035]MDB6454514.1 FAD-dependent urate hydroxylase HpxO [Falsirhodobacter sp. 20TX0035]
MKVIVIGAGIGGLCVGLALRQRGHEVSVFEKVTAIRPVGAGLSLWPNGILCLNHLGLGADVAALGGRMDTMAYADGPGGEVLTRFSLQPLYDASGVRAFPVARAALQSLLMDRFGHDGIRLGTALQEVTDTPTGIRARFSDGTEVEGDLLIGADGAHSRVRAHFLGRALDRRPAGYTNWNGLIPADPHIAPVDGWTTFVAEGKRASVMPVGGGRFYVFFDVPTALQGEPSGDPLADLHRHFGHWCAPVRRMLDAVTAINRVDIHDIEPFDTWVKGRCVLLGDAAHNTTPDLGQGACMAMEDAVVLQRALTDHADLPTALLRYQEERAPRARDLVLRARERSDVTHGVDPAVTADWYASLRGDTGEGILRGIRKTVEGGPLASRSA